MRNDWKPIDGPGNEQAKRGMPKGAVEGFVAYEPMRVVYLLHSYRWRVWALPRWTAEGGAPTLEAAMMFADVVSAAGRNT